MTSSAFQELAPELEVLSPLLLGGAGGQTAEPRAPSLRGALRFWYRAIDPMFRHLAQRHESESRPGRPSWEDRLFGGTVAGSGQSLLRVMVGPETRPPIKSWNRSVSIRSFDKPGGKFPRNGLGYLTYPLQFRENADREFFQPGSRLSFRIVWPARDAEEWGPRIHRAALATVWLLGAFGGLGMRSRRGLGSIAVTNWSELIKSGTSELERDHAALPDLWSARSPGEWAARAFAGLDVMETWFGSYRSNTEEKPEAPRHAHVGDIKLGPLPFGARSWDEALSEAGLKLQDFRSTMQPDYDAVKAAVQAREHGQAPLRLAPRRVEFGLPLSFRFSSLRERTPMTFDGVREGRTDRQEATSVDRHASLLLIRLVRLGPLLHPVFIRLNGFEPGRDYPVQVRASRARDARHRSLHADEGRRAVVDEFMEWLAKGMKHG